MGPDDRATLYSSTEYKKIRLRYFTDDYREWERRTSSGDSQRSDPRLRVQRRRALYRRALQVLPGGVNSPVRAMRQIGRDPIFIERGEGCELVDVDGNRYLDWVGSWGPLILGHADPGGRRRGARPPRRGTSYGAATEGGGRAGRGGRRADPDGRDAADDLLRDRGGDERGAPGPRGHRPRGRRQVLRRLPRPLRRPARRGRVRPRDPRRSPRAPGVTAGPGRVHRRRPLERPRGGRPRPRRAPGRGPAGRAGRRQHGRRPARRRLPRVPPRRDPRRRRPARLRRGDHRLPRRPRRRPGALRGRARPDGPRQGARRRPARGGLRRPAARRWSRSPRPATSTRPAPSPATRWRSQPGWRPCAASTPPPTSGSAS